MLFLDAFPLRSDVMKVNSSDIFLSAKLNRLCQFYSSNILVYDEMVLWPWHVTCALETIF